MTVYRVAVMVEPRQWDTLRRMARVRSVEEEDRVSMSELVRRGIDREIAAIKGLDGQPHYKKPV
jgi:hypothetical protein